MKGNTYRYDIPPDIFEDIWDQLEKSYGQAKEMKGFRIREIETEEFLMRRVAEDSAITLIKKKKYDSSTDQEVNQILGFQER